MGYEQRALHCLTYPSYLAAVRVSGGAALRCGDRHAVLTHIPTLQEGNVELEGKACKTWAFLDKRAAAAVAASRKASSKRERKAEAKEAVRGGVARKGAKQQQRQGEAGAKRRDGKRKGGHSSSDDDSD